MVDLGSGVDSREETGNPAPTGFTVIDVETANQRRASICQVGIVQVQGGEIRNEWMWLVNPEAEFAWFNKRLLRVEVDDVVKGPRFPQVYPQIRDLLSGAITVSHSDFDRQAIDQSIDRYGLPLLDTKWLDSVALARRAWPDRAGQDGYGLEQLAEFLGIGFEHHDALEDARAAAWITLAACRACGCGLDELSREFQSASHRERRNSDPADLIQPAVDSGHEVADILNEAGKVVVVFTGKLSTGRRAAKERAIGAGCTVHDNVTKQTTALVVGMQSPNALKGQEKSSKQRKAEALAVKGSNVAILGERDFWGLIDQWGA